MELRLLRGHKGRYDNAVYIGMKISKNKVY